VFDYEQAESGESEAAFHEYAKGAAEIAGASPQNAPLKRPPRRFDSARDIRVVSLLRGCGRAAAASAPRARDAAARTTGEGSPLLGGDDPELHVAL
jgi:hypothetical protein